MQQSNPARKNWVVRFAPVQIAYSDVFCLQRIPLKPKIHFRQSPFLSNNVFAEFDFRAIPFLPNYVIANVGQTSPNSVFAKLSHHRYILPWNNVGSPQIPKYINPNIYRYNIKYSSLRSSV